MSLPSSSNLVRLSEQAASLSTDLYAVQERSQHETTAREISSIADELSRLSTTLWHLHVAINADSEQYTEAFQEDLAEITNELSAVFEEISECCAGLTMADSNMSAVSWFFKKGRVARLLKHLQALKGTCVVMRTVLWHGKSYGTHTSDRCAESSPHTMQEDRIILESVLAQNRDAILDLHNLTNTLSDGNGKQIERTPSKEGDYYRDLSRSTGVDIPPIPDVLPPSVAQDKGKGKEVTESVLDRTFSKRGIRLGVHMSILDLSTHEAPIGLKRKWIQQAHLRQQLAQPNKGGLTALPELSRISEVDTNAGSSANLQHVQVEPTVSIIPESPNSPRQTPEVPVNTPVAGSLDDTIETPGIRKGRDGTISSKLRRVFSRISLNSMYSPPKSTRNDQPETARSPTPRGLEDTPNLGPMLIENSPSKRFSLRWRQDTENKPHRRTFSEMMKERFAKGRLTTEQFDEEYRHSRL